MKVQGPGKVVLRGKGGLQGIYAKTDKDSGQPPLRDSPILKGSLPDSRQSPERRPLQI